MCVRERERENLSMRMGECVCVCFRCLHNVLGEQGDACPPPHPAERDPLLPEMSASACGNVTTRRVTLRRRREALDRGSQPNSLSLSHTHTLTHTHICIHTHTNAHAYIRTDTQTHGHTNTNIHMPQPNAHSLTHKYSTKI